MCYNTPGAKWPYITTGSKRAERKYTMCINYFDNQINTETKTRIKTKTKDIYIDHNDLLAIYQDDIQGSTYKELKQSLMCYSFEEQDGALLWFEEGYDYTDPDLYADLGFEDPSNFFRFVKLCLTYSEMSKLR